MCTILVSILTDESSFDLWFLFCGDDEVNAFTHT